MKALNNYHFEYVMPSGVRGQADIQAESMGQAWRNFVCLLKNDAGPKSVTVVNRSAQ